MVGGGGGGVEVGVDGGRGDREDREDVEGVLACLVGFGGGWFCFSCSESSVSVRRSRIVFIL